MSKSSLPTSPTSPRPFVGSSKPSFILPIGVDALCAPNSANEVTLRRFLASVDDAYLKHKNIPIANVRQNAGSMAPVNEVTQSLRDHAHASLTPSIVRLGFVLTHIFNLRFCKVVEALHGEGFVPSSAVGDLAKHVSGGSNDSTAAADDDNALSGEASDENETDGPATQETCQTSAGWLEDLQLCAKICSDAGDSDEATSTVAVKKEDAGGEDNATHAPAVVVDETLKSTNTSASPSRSLQSSQADDSQTLFKKYISFGPNSWFRMLPAGLNLAGKIHRVMLRRHVMRWCVLDCCQRVAGTDVVVPSPCAWSVQLQAYEIAMLEILSSQRLADRQLPESYLRLLLWQLQSYAAECFMAHTCVQETDGSRAWPMFPPAAYGPLVATTAPTQQHSSNSNPDGTNIDVQRPTPKFSQPFKEYVQTGALALLSLCYRSTDLLLFGSKCTAVNGAAKDSNDDGWSSATYKGAFRSGPFSSVTGEGATYDVAVMCLVAAMVHTLTHSCGVPPVVANHIRRGFLTRLYGASNPSIAGPSGIIVADEVCDLAMDLKELEAHYARFIDLLAACVKDEVIRRDPPHQSAMEYYDRVVKLCTAGLGKQ